MNNSIHFSKKVFSLFLSVLMLFSICAFSSSAVSINDGFDALEAQFSRDAGPETDGYSIDYSYFSPVKGEDDTTKYPLMIFMAGYTEGEYPGKELTSNRLSTWSSSEMQARFANAGGSYILFARAPEEKGYCWNASLLISPLKAAIDDFLVKHPNVDRNRIYVCGWCLGAIGAANLVSTYSNFFAGLIFMSSPKAISTAEAAKLSNTMVWIFHCKKDSFAPYSLNAETSWNRILASTEVPEKVRFTSFETAPDCGSLLPNHNVWNMIAYDMACDDESYSGMQTVDGKGNVISASEGIITWLSFQKHENHVECSCGCHTSNFLSKLIWRIQVFFWKLLGNTDKKLCECGAKHW